MPAELLEARAIGVRRGQRVLVRELSLSAQAGQLLAIVGPNGAGKSSLIKALAGLWPYSGEVRVGDASLAHRSAAERARLLGYVPQRSALTEGIAVRDVVAQACYARRGGLLGFGKGHAAVVAQALARTGLSALAERAYDTLSGGEQRRVLTARALASEARILLLDEPTAGLDVAHVLRFFALLAELRDEGYALICVLHELDDVLRHADAALLMHEGRCVARGTPAEVLSREHVREIYGVHSHEHAALGFSLDGAHP